MKTLIVAALLLAPLTVAGLEPKSMPDVAVQDSKGAAVRLATYKGRVILVDFWGEF